MLELNVDEFPRDILESGFLSVLRSVIITRKAC